MNAALAAHSIRRHPVFQYASLRHLIDLVDLASVDARVVAADSRMILQAPFILALRGSALVQQDFPLVPGELFWTGILTRLRGMARHPARGLSVDVLTDESVSVEGHAAEGTLILPITMSVLEDATRASTSFGLSVDLRPLGGTSTLHQFFTDKYGPA